MIRGVPAAEPRFCVAQVTEEARDAWRDFCERQGIDRTALAESIAQWMVNHPGELPALVQAWIDSARDLGATRRRRG